MLENETVTGENAKRIINGEQPIVEKPSTEQLAKQKELNDAYMQLSLVDSYSIRDGHLTPRIADEEVREYFIQAYERVIEKLGDQLENQENVEEANQAKELLMFYATSLYGIVLWFWISIQHFFIIIRWIR